MLFNSIEFLVFFVFVFTLYWSVGRSARAQNIVLLAASLIFYGWADLRFMGLLLMSAGMNYVIGTRLVDARRERIRSLVFWFGIVVNLGILISFKYFNFFYESFVDIAHAMGSTTAYDTLQILLPLGVSFFTFQTVGYLIDVRNDAMAPSRDPLAFFTYIFFFPKMLAGPIERAQTFLPQVAVLRVFDRTQAMDGCRRILWGLFAKMVVADNCSRIVGPIFVQYEEMSGTTLLLGAFLHFIQLYSDFSGYSNIALGVSQLLGIRLMRNFAMPQFATNIADFWRRWHISLSTWMMDYLYTPLSFMFRDKGKAGAVTAVFIAFITVGIWHGANWTFVLFGFLQSVYFVPMVLRTDIMRVPKDDGTSVLDLLRMTGIFMLMMFSFVLLPSNTVGQAVHIWSKILSPSLLDGIGDTLRDPKVLLAAIAFFMLVEWVGRRDEHAIAKIGLRWPKPVRLVSYWAVGLSIFLLAHRSQDFIYFQF